MSLPDPRAKTGQCAICGSTYDDYGNNPQPILAGDHCRVCNECNPYVIQVRLGVVKLSWLVPVQDAAQEAVKGT